ncbi:MAG: hypothetical protein U0X87_15025 [Anaerolineales bacterium]
MIISHSFLALFITDAILSCVVALSIRYTPETKPASQHVEHKNESLFLKTISGYRIVLRDFAYMAFTFAGMIVLLVYQLNNTARSCLLAQIS